MSLDYVLIGRRIHDIRKLLHMTQSELAEAVDLTEPYIILPNGKKSMSRTTKHSITMTAPVM